MFIPSTMMTQHPDNAKEYISIQQEPDEAVFSLKSQEEGGLGIHEVMVDFEGKLTPYHQPLQIALELYNNGIIPGKDVFITPRLASAGKESIFRQLMCIMAVIETNISLYEKTGHQAIKEVIIPMCESAQDIIKVYHRIKSVIELGNKNFSIKLDENSIGIIPLFEDVCTLVNVDKLLNEYINELDKEGYRPKYIRYMIGRSDSALSYGIISSVLSVVLSLFKTKKLSEETGINIYPIMGCGTLPFRGHLTYENIENFLTTYSGVKTLTIQSAIRYDHSIDKTKKLIKFINENISKYNREDYSDEDIELITNMMGIATKHYLKSFMNIIDTASNVAVLIPKNRDRLAASKKGLSYSREFVDLNRFAELIKDNDIKKELLNINTNINTSIPRAITFTAAMYTIGMPPELIGTGKALNEIKERFGQEGIDKLIRFYPQLKKDISFALRYANPTILKRFVSDDVRQDFKQEISLINKVLDLNFDLDENVENEYYHTLLKTARPMILHILGKEDQILDSNSQEYSIVKELITKMGIIRGGLG